MPEFVQTVSLTKRYKKQTVVDGLNLRVPRGSVYGFLGPNGSGKSTTMKMILSLVRPSAGQILIDGEPMTRRSRQQHLAHIGSLIESPPGYSHLTGAENMRIIQRLLGLDEEDVSYAVSAVHMASHMDKKVRDYSLGMKQRLGIAMALVRRPSLLILDEPTNGLDPAGIEEIRRLMRRLVSDGITVMVSSHLLGEIDRTANVLGILVRGRLLFQGSRTELMSAAAPDTLVECSDPALAAERIAGSAPLAHEGDVLRVSGLDRRRTARVVASLVDAGIDVYSIYQEEQSLEAVFMALTRGGGL
jgi:ABC transporter related protein